MSLPVLRDLRYQVVCAIELEEAPSATAPKGWTDDLATALWHADRGGDPGWIVYDHQERTHVGGMDPPEEAQWRMELQAFLQRQTRPWERYWANNDPKLRDEASWRARYPRWEPRTEYELAPVRMALYRAMGLERAAWERPCPGELSSHRDGRDLTPGWRLMDEDPEAFLAWAAGLGYAPVRRLRRPGSVLSRDETDSRFRQRVFESIATKLRQAEALDATVWP